MSSYSEIRLRRVCLTSSAIYVAVCFSNQDLNPTMGILWAYGKIYYSLPSGPYVFGYVSCSISVIRQWLWIAILWVKWTHLHLWVGPGCRSVHDRHVYRTCISPSALPRVLLISVPGIMRALFIWYCLECRSIKLALFLLQSRTQLSSTKTSLFHPCWLIFSAQAVTFKLKAASK